jgi:hypothetical protein
MQRALEGAMVALGESKTTDDVAAFLRSTCPELSVSRKDLVSKAIEDAHKREATGSSRDEEALAPTLVGDTEAVSRRGRPSDVGTVELVQRKPKPAVMPETDSSVELDRESIVIPKRSLAWLWITLLLGVGIGVAAFRFPAVTHRALGYIGLGGGEPARFDPPSPPMPSLSASSSAAPSAASSARAQPSTSASASASARPSPSTSASVSAHGPHAPPAHGAPAPPPEPVAPEPTSSVPYSIYKTPPAPAPSTAPASSQPSSNPYGQ